MLHGVHFGTTIKLKKRNFVNIKFMIDFFQTFKKANFNIVLSIRVLKIANKID